MLISPVMYELWLPRVIFRDQKLISGCMKVNSQEVQWNFHSPLLVSRYCWKRTHILKIILQLKNLDSQPVNHKFSYILKIMARSGNQSAKEDKRWKLLPSNSFSCTTSDSFISVSSSCCIELNIFSIIRINYYLLM